MAKKKTGELKHCDVKELPTKSLIPYEFNNRTHGDEQINRIANSIESFGFNQPIVIDEKNVVLVGHGRLLAAKKLGLEMVPTLRVEGLTDADKRAYRILDNKLQNDSTWDFGNLEIELGFLEESGFALPDWGLDSLKGLFPEDEPEIYEDDGPGELPEEPYIKRGDLIELGPHRVLCGDSTSAEDVEHLLNDIKPVLMITDPPYGVDYDPNWRNEAAEKGLISYAARSVGVVENDNRIDWTEVYKLFSCQVAYVWHAGRHAAELARNLESADYKIISQIIWAKPTFAISRGDYHWQHEPCWYAVKNGQTHNWQGSRSESTLWSIERGCKEKTGHGAEKPVECMARPIKNNTKKGDNICDPFLGSGTTLIAADQLGRICYGVEISPQYCQVIIERYQKHCEHEGKDFVCRINGQEFKA